MVQTSKKEGHVLLSGRWFSKKELDDIKYIVKTFPNLSRNELALTICEGLSWLAPNGKHKVESCQKMLEELEKQGEVVLPPKRSMRSPTIPKIKPGSRTNAKPKITGSVGDVAPVKLKTVRSRDGIKLWNEYVERYHALGYKRPFGAHQRYFIASKPRAELLGCLLFSASAWALAERDDWIGWSKQDRSQRLSLIVNNSRFLIFPWVQIKNLASKALSLAAKQVIVDWQERYGFKPVLLETFVDGAEYRGTCYQAANWLYIGDTVGRGRMDRYRKFPSSPKKIYVYPLQSDFKAVLQGKAGIINE